MAVLAGAVVVAGVVPLALHHTGHGAAPAPGISSPEASTRDATLRQPVSLRGIEIDVPGDWRLNNELCGAPQADTVLVDSGDTSPACQGRAPAVAPDTVIWLGPTGRAMPGGQVALTAGRQNGEPILAGRHVSSGPGPAVSYQVVEFPARGVQLVAETHGSSLGSAVLASARPIVTDEVGCPSRQPSPAPLGRPTLAAARRSLIPLGPYSVIGCRYSTGWDDRSTVVPAPALADLVASLHALPAGAPGTAKPPACPAAGEETVLLARYSAAPPLMVVIRPHDCAGYATNGAVTVALPASALEALTTSDLITA